MFRCLWWVKDRVFSRADVVWGSCSSIRPIHLLLAAPHIPKWEFKFGLLGGCRMTFVSVSSVSFERNG